MESFRRDFVFGNNDNFLGFFVSAVLFWIGLTNTLDLYHRGILEVKGVTLPKWIVFWVIPFGGITLALQFARSIVDSLRSKKTTDE